jgi:dolichyl-phosphate-mannose-protein mannosyltransferase
MRERRAGETSGTALTPRFQPELFLLTIFALITRFWGLFSPRAVVWDELHYERFTGAYFTGNYYVDVHPPLGKLLFAAAAKLLGISGDILASSQPAPLLRVLPALAGTLIIPLAYLLLRELGSGRRTATFGALLLLIDNALLVQSRFILPDIILLLFGMLAVLAYAYARHAEGGARFAWVAVAAAAGGIAVSIKWTGLSALGLVGLVWVIEAVRDPRRQWRAIAGEAALFIVIPAAIYFGAFAVHFALLPHGRRRSDPIMSAETRAIMKSSGISPLPDTAPPPSFAKSLVDLNEQMESINASWAYTEHPAASKWYTWPIAKHSIGYWNETDASTGTERWIILFANPMVWWGVMLASIVIVIALIRRSAALAPKRAVLSVLAIGYLGNFVPFAFIHRPMFLYHYFFALVYSVLFAAVGIGALAGWDGDDEKFWRFPGANSRRIFSGVAVVATITFLYLIPISYGWSISSAGMVHRRWILERHVGLTRGS